MKRKGLMLFAMGLVLMIGMSTTCEQACTVYLPATLESLEEAIDDTPKLKNPALYVHVEKATAAADAGDLDRAIKEFEKFMHIGSQKKYKGLESQFAAVEFAFWTCYIGIEDYIENNQGQP